MEENQLSKEQMKEGFRVGEYFVTFPPGDFVHEDKDGNVSVDVDIYRIDKDRLYKVNGQITEEVEKQISDELNRMLTAAVDLYKEKEQDV
jgi:hypothetical protein